MNKRSLFLLLLLLIVSGGAAYLYMDWMAPQPIQIAYSVRPAPAPRRPQVQATRRGARRATAQPIREDPASGKQGYNVTFVLNEEVNLTAVKVVTLQDALTNKYPYAIWKLISDSNSPPIKTFIYGGGIRGMHPVVSGGTAVPLQAGGAYRLIIEAGDRMAEKDFQIPAPSRSQP
jgi:hypothetical protein